jgi:hypothetical protein
MGRIIADQRDEENGWRNLTLTLGPRITAWFVDGEADRMPIGGKQGRTGAFRVGDPVLN